ncbi:MAG: hypothetical protein ABJR05_14190 [Balneola sp.]
MKQLVQIPSILFLAVVLINCVHGQGPKNSTTRLLASSAFVNIGYSVQSYDQKFTSLASGSKQYSDYKNINLGFGGSVYFEKWVYGGEGNIQLSDNISFNSSKYQRSSGSGLVHAGYIIQKNKRMILYPSLGFGIAGTQLKLRSNGNPYSSASYLLTKLGIHTDFFLRPNHQNGGILVGLSLSYRIYITDPVWNIDKGFESDNNHGSQFPPISNSKIDFSIKIGWGVKREF